MAPLPVGNRQRGAKVMKPNLKNSAVQPHPFRFSAFKGHETRPADVLLTCIITRVDLEIIAGSKKYLFSTTYR